VDVKNTHSLIFSDFFSAKDCEPMTFLQCRDVFQSLQDNIRSFHGDGDMITLFGESAGAGSVSTHLISPVSRHIPR
jgi:carboxylesterase type B